MTLKIYLTASFMGEKTEVLINPVIYLRICKLVVGRSKRESTLFSQLLKILISKLMLRELITIFIPVPRKVSSTWYVFIIYFLLTKCFSFTNSFLFMKHY